MIDEMPIFLNVHDWVRYFHKHGPPTVDELLTACFRVGRNPAVSLLTEVEAAGLLNVDAARVVGDVWSQAEFPEHSLDRARWVELFDVAGYTADGELTERPPHAQQLYRGATFEERAGMSWTDRVAVAERFANGQYMWRRTGQVWTALVEPSRLLCHNGAQARDESEYVVNTSGLVIESC